MPTTATGDRTSPVKEADRRIRSASIPNLSTRYGSKNIVVKEARGYTSFSDGSRVVEVVDLEFNASVFMRRFVDGSLIPLDQDY